MKEATLLKNLTSGWALGSSVCTCLHCAVLLSKMNGNILWTVNYELWNQPWRWCAPPTTPAEVRRLWLCIFVFVGLILQPLKGDLAPVITDFLLTILHIVECPTRRMQQCIWHCGIGIDSYIFSHIRSPYSNGLQARQPTFSSRQHSILSTASRWTLGSDKPPFQWRIWGGGGGGGWKRTARHHVVYHPFPNVYMANCLTK
jgi:hypothetical protein